MEDWYSRTELLLGSEHLERLRSAHVLVVGVGGVGAYAAEMICRAGVGNITIVDGDVVNPSNINRQLIARHSTIGQSKVELLAKRLIDINPELKLKVHHLFLEDDEINNLLDSDTFNYVIDAIDTLSPKVFLIYNALKRKIKIVSSMGAGGRIDPSKIGFTDISKTYHCTLAKSVRKRLVKLGISKGLPVVFSSEQPKKEAVLATENERFKKSTVGTVSYMPAIFGCYLASYVIRKL